MPSQVQRILSRAKCVIKSIVTLFLGLLFRYVCGGKHECIPPITDLLLLDSATASALKIRSRKLKCKTLVESYINRIKDVEPFINATSDTRYEAALEEAAAVDKLMEVESLDRLSSLQPLLGVPFTVVGALAVRGQLHHCGIYTHWSRKADSNATAVELLVRAGAVPLAVSNVPELCLGAETTNHINGHTNNPCDLTRSPGGCSGGEAALLASAASVIGLGSDWMGEARLAAAFCGVFAHKPTAGVVSNVGHYLEFPTELDAFRCIAPMCRCASDLGPVLEVISGSNASALKLNDEVNIRHIKWYFLSDVASHLSGTDQRKAVQKVQTRIEQVHSIKTRALNIPDLELGFRLWRAKYIESRGLPWVTRALGSLQGDLSPLFHLPLALLGLSRHTLTAVLASIWDDNLDLQADTQRSLCTVCDDLGRFLDRTLGSDGVLVLPGPQLPPPHHFQSLLQGTKLFGPLCPFNVIGCPVTMCPIEGAAVQVVACKGNDRLCLAVAAELERAFGGWQSPTPIC
ncbi:fatty-acid amide hydrolase 2-A-like [Ornithodoros turicata]|uniref:fatty-acid amide hydrolase 2-A-like n=1 Tax=Ornithodoros turicata TaxID=34597 RepID=UPI003139E288